MTETTLESIFFAALERSPTERETYLDEACARDPEMRARLEKMLAAQPDLGQFLAESHTRPAGGPQRPGTLRATEALAGASIAGRYKLLQQIGEGGMGTVWMAEQLEPVKRRVAVKLINSEHGRSREILARFAAERQAIALMDHPHIAKLLDAGTTGEAEALRVGSGRPYFVMELVKGGALNEYCDQNRLPVPARLRLFVQVCSAVQHAHQKGVIHRDLKPANILVESHDSGPVPRVIDFGLAKAIGGVQLTENTLFTRLGTVAGTPLYMAPEQATFNALDVDTRADVYALGVILYELLTGTTPVESELLKRTPFDEILRVIRESDPPAPSKRLSSAGSKPGAAAARQTVPLKLGRLVRGELDWIVMKALAKERDRRYESAAAFASDVERFLSQEPVLAGPPAPVYRLRKFARRNSKVVLASGLLLTAILIGIFGATFGFIRAERARANEAEQREAAEDAQARESEQRRKAEKARDRTRQALDALTSSVTGDSLATQQAISAEQKKFLSEVLAHYQDLAAEEADDEPSRARTAAAALRVGLIEYRLGRTAEALVACRLARDGYARLVADFPAEPRHRNELGRCHTNLGLAFYFLGKRADAEEQFRSALAVHEKLAADYPEVREYRQELGAKSSNLGTLLNDPEYFRKALAIREKLAADFPHTPTYRHELAVTCYNLGNLLRDLKQHGKAEEQQRRALLILQPLVADPAAPPAYRHALASSHNSLGNVLRDVPNKDGEAEEEYRKALAIREKLAAEFPSEPGHRQHLASSHNNLAVALKKAGVRPGAEEHYRKAVTIREKLVADFPGTPVYQVELSAGYSNFAGFVQDGDRPEGCLIWFDRAIGALTGLYERDRDSPPTRQRLATLYERRARAHDQLRKFTEANRDWSQAIEFGPVADQPAWRAKRATSRLNAGLIAEAMEGVAELTKSSNWDSDQWYDFARLYAVASGRSAADGPQYADRALELLQKAVGAGFKDAARMAKDEDLDALRGRDDFKNLQAQLAKK